MLGLPLEMVVLPPGGTVITGWELGAGAVVVVLAEEDPEVRIAVEVKLEVKVKLVVEVKFVVEVEVDDCGDEKHSIRPSGYLEHSVPGPNVTEVCI